MTELDTRPVTPAPGRGPGLRVVLVDGLVALSLCTLSAGALGSSSDGSFPVPWAAALVSLLALVVRRVRPEIMASVVGVAGLVEFACCVWDRDGLLASGHGGAVGAFMISSLVGVYSIAAHGRRAWAYAGLAAAELGALSVTWLTLPRSPAVAQFVPLGAVAALVAGMWAMGWVRRARRETLEMLTERNRALEAERESASAKAAADERTRIAREMHDIVAHSLSSVIAQADGGRYAARADPAVGVRALETIAATSRQALADMRALLGVLRDETDRTTSSPPGLADLDELLAHERELGGDVTATTTGAPRTVAPALGLTAYRIVQESLTNARLHAAPGARTTVALHWGADTLTLEITDVAPGEPAHSLGPAVPRGGRGVLGMRERAALHGGTVETGPTARGHRVRAVLPLDGGAGTIDPEETP